MTVKEVSVTEAQQLSAQGWTLLDVRTPGEWAAIHAQGAINLPLDKIGAESVATLCGNNKKILTICHSGGRSKKACELLSGIAGVKAVSVAGGTSAWTAAGYPIEKGTGVISIERQVRIIAGVLVLIGVLLGIGLNSVFLIIPLLVGAGLTFAGITDYCGMAMLLARMPWNRNC